MDFLVEFAQVLGLKPALAQNLQVRKIPKPQSHFLRPRKVALVPPEGSNLTTHASK
jgi:hypothetical protein